MFHYQGVPNEEPQDKQNLPSLEPRPISNSRLWKAICSILILIVVAETTALLLPAPKCARYPTQKKMPVPQCCSTLSSFSSASMLAKTNVDLKANIVPHQDSVFIDDQRFRNLLSPEAVESSWDKLIKSISSPSHPSSPTDGPWFEGQELIAVSKG